MPVLPAPRFRVLLTLVFGLLTLLIIGAISLGLQSLVRERIAGEQEDAIHTLARNTAAVFAEGLEERMREVTLVAASRDLRRQATDSPAWRDALAQLGTRNHFVWAGVTDLHGTVRAATQDMLVGVDVSQRPWFGGARSGPYAGNVHAAKLLAELVPRAADGQPMRFVDFAAPLLDLDGQLVGVLGVHGSWEWARSTIRKLRSERLRDRGVLVYVFDAQGDLIHRPLGDDAAGLPPAPQGRALAPGHAVMRWSDGHEYMTAAARVDATGPASSLKWTIVVRQPLDEAMQVADAAAQRALGIGLLCGLLGLLPTWWLAGRLSAPLQSIAQAASRIRDGELDVRLPDDHATQELDVLSRSLREMTDTLVQQREALSASNHELELRVAERTHELESASRELERLARHDVLTGLPNRRAAEERLALDYSLWTRHRTPFGLMLVDVDHFKQVNDVHGHDVGDAVLVEVGRRLGSVCRSSDSVCRWGGEEFLVMVAHTDLPGTLAVAEKLRAAVALPPPEGLPAITASIGVAMPAEHGRDVTQVLKAADAALYQAKRSGRNRACAAPVTDAEATVPDALAPAPGPEVLV